MLSPDYWRSRQLVVRRSLDAVKAEPARHHAAWPECLTNYLSWLRTKEAEAERRQQKEPA